MDWTQITGVNLNNLNITSPYLNPIDVSNQASPGAIINGLVLPNSTLTNQFGTQIVNPPGLVSTINFPNNEIIDNTQRDITSATFVDVTNTSLTTSSLVRPTNALVLMNVQGRLYLPSTDQIQTGEVVLNVDGTNQTLTIFDQSIRDTRMSTAGVFSFDSRNFSLSANGIFSLSAGTHTLKLQALVDGQTLRILNTSIIYLILGS